ncbi:replication termination factor 2 [Leptopilina heterotoma]|uniref:replication termination factor 2 n=1 Tax=Leptopilina heterotoma TaxID=63436 RepID=UPI001CA93253|nr:replication termination factor 2 [Leptopilina heterotoma]
MGCDGGTIPRRDELVRVKKKPEQKDKEAELAFRWKHCSIRQSPLQTPIVSCGLGRLYSKESVLEGLLDRSLLPETATHIKNLKDVKTLNLTSNTASSSKKVDQGDGCVDGVHNPYICPIIGLEMSGKFKFCFLWSCGCVMSERAIKEIKTNICHKCQQPFTENDVVIMNAEDDDLRKMEERLVIRKAERKASKKKIKKEEATEEVEAPKKKIKKEEQASCSKLPNQVHDSAYNKTKEDYSVAKDPKASEVFKSIFTSHKSASDQTRAHWVTYNPFYN